MFIKNLDCTLDETTRMIRLAERLKIRANTLEQNALDSWLENVCDNGTAWQNRYAIIKAVYPNFEYTLDFGEQFD